MGGSRWSDDAADRLRTARSSLKADDVFVHSRMVGRTHALLDPKGVKVRESRDSDVHPESNAIALFFDVTGSMGIIPKMFAMEKFPGLMKLLATKGYIDHPQILFGAIGDATFGDRSPLQVGQFESGLEMDDCLTNLHLEGGGGGGMRESYELALYFAARHMAMDCLEKRNKKGYLFLMGDEMCYANVFKDQVFNVIGDALQDNVPVEDIVKECEAKFESFFIYVNSGSYGGHQHEIQAFWKKLYGERMLVLDDPKGVCELIGLTIGACEGRDLDAMHSDIVATPGMTATAADAAKRAIVPFIGSVALRKGSVDGDLAPVSGSASGTKRL